MNPLFLLMFFVCAGAAGAADRAPEFAYGAQLEADGREALYEVTLPAAVYRGVARADLGDVRVFNGADEVVPYAWQPRRMTSTETAVPVALTLFPLKAESGGTLDGLSIRVRRGADGSSSIDVNSTGARGGKKRTVGYLVDLTRLERALHAIEFDWEPSSDGYAGKLRIDASDDLATWRTLVAAAPLISLEVAGQRLQQKRAELPQRTAKYLRLSWLPQAAGPKPPELTAARGELAGKITEAPREWTEAEAGKGDKPGEYVFDLHGYFPADRMRVLLPEPNTVAQVELLARTKADQPWRPVARGVAYRLRQGEGEITNPDLYIALTADRYWLLRVDQRGGGVGAAAPKLELGWVPHRLVFAARGKPPFQLAYGNREARSAALAIETMIPDYRNDAGAQIRATATSVQRAINVKHAQVLEQKELGGDARRAEAVDWKRWSLWGALLLGVIILGAMAWRLARQLPSPHASSSRDDTNQE